MAEGAGNRPSNIFCITVAGQRDRGEKERNRSNTGPRRPLSYRHGDRPSELRSEGVGRPSVSDETETACGGRTRVWTERPFPVQSGQRKGVFSSIEDLGQRLEAAKYVIDPVTRPEEHTSELQSLRHLVCRLLLEKNTKEGI